MNDKDTTHATRRRRGLDHSAIEGYMAELARLVYSPPEIREKLIKEFGAKNVPSLRTIQRFVRTIRPPPDDEPWSLANSSGKDAHHVLETLAAVIENTEGRRKHLTRKEAEWIIKIRTVAPGLLPVDALRFADAYMLREGKGENTEDLDLALAFAPATEEKSSDFVRRVKAHASIHHQCWPGRVFIVFPPSAHTDPELPVLVLLWLESTFNVGLDAVGLPRSSGPGISFVDFLLHESLRIEIRKTAEEEGIDKQEVATRFLEERLVNPSREAKRPNREFLNEAYREDTGGELYEPEG